MINFSHFLNWLKYKTPTSGIQKPCKTDHKAQIAVNWDSHCIDMKLVAAEYNATELHKFMFYCGKYDCYNLRLFSTVVLKKKSSLAVYQSNILCKWFGQICYVDNDPLGVPGEMWVNEETGFTLCTRFTLFFGTMASCHHPLYVNKNTNSHSDCPG